MIILNLALAVGIGYESFAAYQKAWAVDIPRSSGDFNVFVVRVGESSESSQFHNMFMCVYMYIFLQIVLPAQCFLMF